MTIDSQFETHMGVFLNLKWKMDKGKIKEIENQVQYKGWREQLGCVACCKETFIPSTDEAHSSPYSWYAYHHIDSLALAFMFAAN